ncbi:MAG TPA: ferrous iron transport protein B [Bacteroidota bacterium]|nr:ferrous iron transport protein B [Bacteroidota bacterium]
MNPVRTEKQLRHIAIIGNPNAGKTTLFNALTGLRQKVGNYPGVTVEKKEGRIVFDDGHEAILLDLPGTYSLTANSPDEKVAVDVLLGRSKYTAVPELVICVVDASNLERNLYLISQIIDNRIPTVIALNMFDVAERDGLTIDTGKLSEELGVKVIPTIGSKGVGIKELKRAIAEPSAPSLKSRQWKLPQPVQEECDELKGMLQKIHHLAEPLAFHEAIVLLTSSSALAEHNDHFAPELIDHVKKDHLHLERLGIDRNSVFVESRYEWIKRVCASSVVSKRRSVSSTSDKIDRILTHKVWGFVIFLGLMVLMFQAIFSWANAPMLLIGDAISWVDSQIILIMPPGDLRDLIVNGAIAGVGAVVTFLPQILFLFLFIGFLEDTGYMARAAFIMDRLMSKVGLHGKSFIPILSSFACAIPGIMATRTIENRKDRLVTMLVSPLVSCSARLPVYALMIAAFIPPHHVLGIFSLPGLTLVAMYLLGLVAALTMAWFFKKTLLKSETPAFIMELPPYKMPSLKSVILHMWERSKLFLERAGTIILGVSIVLWFLATYPKVDHGSPAERLDLSFAGRAGHLIEPVIRPLGFDWKIGIGLIGSVLQREVFVSTMGTIYNIKDAKDENGGASLQDHMRHDVDPRTGLPTFTTLTAICLMVYYVLAMQCMSTVAVMRRETNGWKWPMFQVGYMTLLAYSVTFVVYRAGLFLMALHS